MDAIQPSVVLSLQPPDAIQPSVVLLMQPMDAKQPRVVLTMQPMDAAFEDMGLCPIAPPKGFPLALWKPSGANTSFFLEISVLLT